jgi:hypothetical protein
MDREDNEAEAVALFLLALVGDLVHHRDDATKLRILPPGGSVREMAAYA